MNSRVTILLLGTFVLTIGCSRNPSDEGSAGPVVKARGERAKATTELDGADPKEPAASTRNGDGTNNAREPEGPKFAPTADAHSDVAEPVLGAGTGTAFVVHPDGYLITNAHVVQLGNGKIGQLTIDKVAIDLDLDNKSYSAKVLAVDEQNDLALLKINAKDLPALPLSERVTLAEEVRAFGYPLSDILGEGITITRGSIAGIDKAKLRTDTTVNPGNSGGPLVNNKGEVVGVVVAKLKPEVGTLGFAVPINFVKSLLAKQKVELTPAKEQRPLDGAALVRRTLPSVGFVRVTILQATLKTGPITVPTTSLTPEYCSLSLGGRYLFMHYQKSVPFGKPGHYTPANTCYKVWSVDGGRLLADVELPKDWSIPAVSADGRWMILRQGWGRQGWLVHPTVGDLSVFEWTLARYESERRTAISADGKLAAMIVSKFEGRRGETPSVSLRIYETDSGKEKRIQIDDRTWNGLSFSSDGRMIAARGVLYEGGKPHERHVFWWNIEESRLVASAKFEGIEGDTTSFSATGQFLHMGGRVFDTRNGNLVRELREGDVRDLQQAEERVKYYAHKAWFAHGTDILVAEVNVGEPFLSLWDVHEWKELVAFNSLVYDRESARLYRDRVSREAIDDLVVIDSIFKGYSEWIVSPDLRVAAVVRFRDEFRTRDKPTEMSMTFFNLEYRLKKFLASK